MKLNTAYEVLSDIIREGAYANIALNSVKDDSERAFVTRVVYGVLENYFQLDYIIGTLAPKRPKAEVRVLLLLGVYCLNYTDMPPYAVVNELVQLCKMSKFQAASGFVNSVLHRAAQKDYRLPAKGAKAEEIKYNLPYDLLQLIKNEYPRAYGRILQTPPKEEEHIRLSPGTDESVLSGIPYQKTATGYYVQNTPEIKRLYNEGKLTYQSYTSTLAVLALGDVQGKRVLDLCAAPGGKSVYIAQRGGIVTACDIYPHRTQLIKSYADRMSVELEIITLDGTKLNEDWVGAFDIVLLDAPCSGLGALGRRRDIILNRKKEDIARLAQLQKQLLAAAAQYVKPQGVLVYSTCTILKQENGGVVAGLLSQNADFEPDEIPIAYKNKGELQFLPDADGTDGFYIARLIKKEGNNNA